MITSLSSPCLVAAEMEAVLGFLRTKAQGDLVLWADQAEAARSFGFSLSAVERIALENNLLPARYQRNREMISCRQQLQLFNSRVVVAGCGGLGGYIIEELARLGVGQIVAIDPDQFEEHNLNRQLFSSLSTLGRKKVDVAAERILQINPALNLEPRPEAFGRDNGARLLEAADIAVDGLDSISARRELAAACREVGIPLVHGAIAGWYGQLVTQLPDETSLETLYPQGDADRGIEQALGNPSFTPAVVASLQVAEVCKLLLSEGQPLRGRTLSIDLREMEFCQIPSPVSCKRLSAAG